MKASQLDPNHGVQHLVDEVGSETLDCLGHFVEAGFDLLCLSIDYGLSEGYSATIYQEILPSRFVFVSQQAATQQRNHL
eukprot:79364-Amphidinium_carterae.1